MSVCGLVPAFLLEGADQWVMGSLLLWGRDERGSRVSSKRLGLVELSQESWHHQGTAKKGKFL